MRKKPWSLIVLAILHIISPFLNIIVSGTMEGFGVFESFTKAFSADVLYYNKLSIILPVIAGVAIYICKMWSFFVYIFCMSGLIFYNLIALRTSDNANTLVAFGVFSLIMINILLVCYFSMPAVRRVYLDRRIRWWENQPRYAMDEKCTFYQAEDDNSIPFTGVIMNFSENGMFLKTMQPFTQSAPIKIEFNFLDKVFEFEGITVFHYAAGENSGYGIKFNHNSYTKKDSKEIVKHLKAKGHNLTRQQQTEEDKFTVWLKSVLTSGQGIVPTMPDRDQKTKS